MLGCKSVSDCLLTCRDPVVLASLVLSSTANSRPRVLTSLTGRRPSTKVRVVALSHPIFRANSQIARRQCEEAYDNQYVNN